MTSFFFRDFKLLIRISLNTRYLCHFRRNCWEIFSKPVDRYTRPTALYVILSRQTRFQIIRELKQPKSLILCNIGDLGMGYLTCDGSNIWRISWRSDHLNIFSRHLSRPCDSLSLKNHRVAKWRSLRCIANFLTSLSCCGPTLWFFLTHSLCFAEMLKNKQNYY